VGAIFTHLLLTNIKSIMKKRLLFTAIASIGMTVTTFAQVPTYVPTTGLKGYWTFDGNGNDLSANGNDLTTNGSISYGIDRFGNVNSAALFDAANEYFNKTSPVLPSGNQSRSVSFWYNSTGITYNTDNNQVPFAYGDLTSGSCFERFKLIIFATQYYFHGKCLDFGWPSVNATNSWIHVVLLYDVPNNLISIYKNGVLLSSQNIGGSLNTPLTVLQIGMGPDASPSEANAQFDGKLDEFAIYDRVISTSEINQLFAGTCTPDITSGLLLKYDFTGNANDQSGNSYNGTVNGATLTTDRFGNVSSAYNFNGTSDFIDVADNTALRLNNTDFTISVWINETSRSSTQESIISKRSGAGGNGYILNIEGSVQPVPGLTNFHVSGGGDPRAFSNTIVPLSAWKHIALSYELSSQTLKTYIDGILDSTTTGIPSPNSATNVAMKIGTDAAGNPYFFHGKIDDIKIYNRALTNCDIDSLFNEMNSLPTGISSQVNSSTINIYPNPANNIITVECASIKDLPGYTFIITNPLGQQVFQTTLIQQHTYIDLSTVTARGIYFAHLIDVNGNIREIKKIILQ